MCSLLFEMEGERERENKENGMSIKGREMERASERDEDC